MPRLENTALIQLDLGGTPVSFRMNGFGTPDRVRTALRRACAHRRPIVLARSRAYIANVAYELRRVSSVDCVEILSSSDTPAAYRYYVDVDKRDVVSIGIIEPSYETLRRFPFFAWLGATWKRPTKPAKSALPYRGKRRGRPASQPIPLEKAPDDIFNPNNPLKPNFAKFVAINDRVSFDVEAADSGSVEIRKWRVNFRDIARMRDMDPAEISQAEKDG